MRSRWGIILLLSVVIAGCTRDAGVQPFEPVAPSGDVTTPDTQPTATEISITVEGEAQSAQTEEAAPTDEPPPSPTTPATDTPVPTETDLPVLEVTDTPTTAPTNTPRPSPTTAPTNTPAEPTAADEDEMGAMTDATEEVTGETDDEEAFTPGGTGLVPPDVVTNTPPPTSTPLPTPEGAAPSSETNEDSTTAEEAEGVAVGDPCVYVVQAGDNAFRIAVNNNVTLDELVEANPSLSGSNPVIQPGQELVIPGCESDGTEDEEPAEATDEAPTPPPPGFETYTVTSGDTLVAIARRYGTTVDAIVDANDLTNPNRLSIGQELLIPIEAGN